MKYLAYRKRIESELNSRFRFILNGSKEQQDARNVSMTILTRFCEPKLTLELLSNSRPPRKT